MFYYRILMWVTQLKMSADINNQFCWWKLKNRWGMTTGLSPMIEGQGTQSVFIERDVAMTQ